MGRRVLIFGVLAVLGGAAGVGAGYALRPAAEVTTDASTEDKPEAATIDEKDVGDTEIVKFNNQFIVPILKDGRVTAMIVLTLSLETLPGSSDVAYTKEPKIRDQFLQVLFDHANAGGFDGTFTAGERLENLRTLLRAATIPVLGNQVVRVLVTDITRQDM